MDFNILMCSALQQIFVSLILSALKYIFLRETKGDPWIIHSLRLSLLCHLFCSYLCPPESIS